MKVIVDRSSRTLLALNTDLPPEGIECDVMELSDADAVLIGTTNARYSVDGTGRLVVVEVAETPAPPTIDDQIAALQAAVLSLALGV